MLKVILTCFGLNANVVVSDETEESVFEKLKNLESFQIYISSYKLDEKDQYKI